MTHSTGTRRIKQILRGLHLRSYLVHIINKFMILVPCIHFRMYIGTRAENENSDYFYFIYTVMKVLLSIYVHRSVVHSYGITCSTSSSSSSYSSSLSAYRYLFWQSSEHRQRSVQTSQAFWHWQRLLEQRDLAHLHRTSCIIACGTGGRFVMTGTHFPSSSCHP